MVPTPSLTWLAFYARNREDNGAFQKMYESELGPLAAVTKTHLDDALAFTDTIAGSAYGNMVMVPGLPGKFHILHHGFTCTTSKGTSMIFVLGNLSDCSYFKVLPRAAAVEQIKVTTGPRVRSTNCPTLADMLASTTEDEFKALPAQGNGILRQHPNHLMINPEIFMMADGATSVNAKTLAATVIAWFREHAEEDEDDEDLRALKTELKSGAESLLAMLWASENEGLTPIELVDVEDDPVLNNIIREIKGKLGVGGAARAAVHDENTEAFVLSSQSIVNELNRMHEDRTAERSRTEDKTSLLKTIDPVQKALFVNLCTTDLTIPPEMTEFMKTLTKSATPQKAIGLLKNRALDWEGTFAEGCCHRLLANGFLSLETNRANPGGFTVFMFHPRTVDMGTRTFDSTTATLREYFGMDVEDSTVAYYAKQGFFHPTNSHDLRIQLQTALDMLELLTCKNSIATRGLHYILDPPRWRRYATEIHDRFVAEKAFGTKFLYTVDRTLQTLFRRLSHLAEGDTVMEGSPTFLIDHAVDLIGKLEAGASIAVTLPASLIARGGRADAADGSPATKKAKTKSSGGTETTAPKKTTPYRHHSEEHVNTHPHLEWLVPKDTDFLALFKDRSPGSQNWPKLQDTRLPKKNRQTKSAPMCARFQMTKKCTYGCQLAHVLAQGMTQPEFLQVDRIMREILAPKTT
ncbi:hypothetical protein MHU86_21192 [Fragilaria crotonensis]|nr:hypothetical protein MHU86_21192 [Fragilaria crotonensis]